MSPLGFRGSRLKEQSGVHWVFSVVTEQRSRSSYITSLSPHHASSLPLAYLAITLNDALLSIKT